MTDKSAMPMSPLASNHRALSKLCPQTGNHDGAQYWKQTPGMSAEETRKSDLILVVALDTSGFARGDVYWDDGESLDTFQKGDYTQVVFLATHGVLLSEVIRVNSQADSVKLGMVQVYGVADPPSKVLVNGKPYEQYSYDQDTKILSISQLSLPLGKPCTIMWS